MRSRLHPIAAIAAALLACPAVSGGYLLRRADPAAAPVPDNPFWQDYHAAYPLSTPAENDVRALALDGRGRLWAATAAGVRRLEASRWTAPPGGNTGLAYALCRDGRGVLWAGTWNGVYRVGPDAVMPAGLQGRPIGAVAALPTGGVVAAGPDGIWAREGGVWRTVRGSWHRAVRAVLPASRSGLWVGTASGLYLVRGDGASVRYSRPNVLLSSSICCLAPLPDGGFCVGSTGGLDFYRGARREGSVSVPQGLPCRDVRGVARDGEGRLWVATALGVARYEGGRWSLRHSRRWLQSDDVRAVAVGPDGTAWVATAAGVDAIRRRRMTLEQKAAHYLRVLRARHIRPPGLVGPAVLASPGDLSRSFVEDDDNDGEHTGMYCALESMRYAVTRAPDARRNARAAFHALLELQRATGTRHFIARSVLPAGTPPRHEVDRTYTPQEAADTHRADPREKVIEKRWVPSPDGRWLWKRDASSDEVVGHMFAYATYYDLAADPAERRLVADLVDRLVGGIVDHGYVLQDVDGKGTQWGNWSPASLNGDPTWHEERAGNSAEMLAHLGVAYHVTGKPRYREAARALMQRHGYGRNMLDTAFDTPSERTYIEYELLSMVYPNLLRHPALPAVVPLARASLRTWHRGVATDGAPFYDFVYARFSGRRFPLARAAETLRDWPLDLVEWTVDNSQREDVAWDRTPGREPGMLTRILPRSEIGLSNWDNDPHRAVSGSDGRREDRATDWLLAYWMGRYDGLVGAPRGVGLGR